MGKALTAVELRERSIQALVREREKIEQEILDAGRVVEKLRGHLAQVRSAIDALKPAE